MKSKQVKDTDQFDLETIKRNTAKAAYEYAKGNLSFAARLMGVDRRTFQRNFGVMLKGEKK